MFLTIIVLIDMWCHAWCFTTEEPFIREHPDGYRQGLRRGHASHISKHPYLVAVVHDNRTVCSASILAKRWLLTSQSCTMTHEADDILIRAGSQFLHKGGQLLEVKRIHEFPHNPGTWGHDMALIELKEKIKFGEWAKPIKISTDPSIAIGDWTNVCGWGYESPNASEITVVEDTYPIIDFEDCSEFFNHQDYSEVVEWTFCTFKRGHVPCLYDDGNPLTYKDELIGVYSHTLSCIEGFFPARWCNTSYHIDWIWDTIKIYES